MRIFGSIAYAKILGQLRKLDDRSKKYVFMGYVPNGYRLWNSEKGKIVIARDVKIEEKLEPPTQGEENEIFIFKPKHNENESEEEREAETQQEENEEELQEEMNYSSEYHTQEEEEDDDKEELRREQTIRKSTRIRKSPQRYRECAYLTYE